MFQDFLPVILELLQLQPTDVPLSLKPGDLPFGKMTGVPF